MPNPEQCKCWGAPLHTIFPKWAARAQARVVRMMSQGHSVPPLETLQREATLVRALAEKRRGPLEARYRKLGHLCEECPFRSRPTPKGGEPSP